MPGQLYICATPIGNLDDISDRLSQVLKEVDVVYAEDTRRARKLLDRVGSTAPATSYFLGNEATRSNELGARLARGDSVALVTDAGTPTISDPGLSAVRAAIEVGAAIIPIPGPSAVTAALAVAHVPTERFVFEGFLPRKGTERTRRIEAIGREERTVVWFTTANRIAADLDDLAVSVDAARQILVARELTKLHEELWRGTLLQARAEWGSRSSKGEFTVVLEGAVPVEASMDDALGEVEARIAEGMSMKDAVTSVAAFLGVGRRDLYERTLAERD